MSKSGRRRKMGLTGLKGSGTELVVRGMMEGWGQEEISLERGQRKQLKSWENSKKEDDWSYERQRGRVKSVVRMGNIFTTHEAVTYLTCI